jgi:hypothetical protein
MDRQRLDEYAWWGKTSWHRNNGASDEVGDLDGRWS